jgi:enoyl-CoA hydratase/carnithine racemase
MPVQQTRMRITTDDGVATLWLGGGSEFHFDDLADLARTLDELERIPALELVVLRADAEPDTPSIWQARPLLIHPDDSCADRFARRGAVMLDRLRNWNVPTLAFIEGACTGLGLELALSCDERLGISGPTANYGYGPAPTAWGGRQRAAELLGLRRAAQLVQHSVTARQAHRLGILERVCCQRRAKIDLQEWIDHRVQQPALRRQPKWWVHDGLSAERRAFRKAALAGMFDPTPEAPSFLNPLQPLVNVALVGDHPHWPILARESSLRGVVLQCVGFERPGYAEAIRAGRVTPLEATHAFAKLTDVPDAVELQPSDLVMLDDHTASMAMMLERDLPARTILVLPELAAMRLRDLAVRPQRVLGWHWQPEGYEFTGYGAATQQLSVWFENLGVPHTVRSRDTDRYEAMEATPIEIGYDGLAIRGADRATPTSLHTD